MIEIGLFRWVANYNSSSWLLGIRKLWTKAVLGDVVPWCCTSLLSGPGASWPEKDAEFDTAIELYIWNENASRMDGQQSAGPDRVSEARSSDS
jgi:hypothetical protein